MTLAIEEEKVEKSYTFDEAIDLSGTGWYNTGLLAATSLSLLAVCIDIFSMSVVVPLCACDLQLDLMQKSVLVSMPFLGPVFTAYCWGYVADTRGRRLSILVGMVVSFLMTTLSAFSPNWIVMAVCKFIATCFSSSAQSATFALLGESCPERIKGKYMLVMSSIVHQGSAVYQVLAYLIGHLDFSYDLGLINFVPWRLLILALALPLGLSAAALMFFYESPKFLLNAGRGDEALEVLRRIHRRNCKKTEFYPVEKLVLNEKGNVQSEKVPLLQSLHEQTVPLFKPPLLFNTLLLYSLLVVVYGVTGSLYIWLPFIAQAFTSDSGDYSEGLCSVISHNNTLSSSSGEQNNCQAVDLMIVVAVLISATFYTFLNFMISMVASRKRLLMISILSAAAVSCLLTTVIPNMGSGIAYLGVLSSTICMGPTFAYFVDLYPTSYRGMAACLGVMVSRVASVAGINLVGPFITNQCTYTFYALTAVLISGALMSLLLPLDRPKAIQ